MQAARTGEQRREPGAAGRQSGLAFFLVTFSWRNKKKSLAGQRRKPAVATKKNPFFIGNQRAVFAAWRQVGFSEPPGSAPDARAYFFLFRQEKVAKKKATPAYAVGCADSLALLEVPGGCGTRLGCAKPQTVLADYPRPFSAAQRFRWGPGTASQFAGSTSKKHLDDFDALV